MVSQWSSGTASERPTWFVATSFLTLLSGIGCHLLFISCSNAVESQISAKDPPLLCKIWGAVEHALCCSLRWSKWAELSAYNSRLAPIVNLFTATIVNLFAAMVARENDQYKCDFFCFCSVLVLFCFLFLFFALPRARNFFKTHRIESRSATGRGIYCLQACSRTFQPGSCTIWGSDFASGSGWFRFRTVLKCAFTSACCFCVSCHCCLFTMYQ